MGDAAAAAPVTIVTGAGSGIGRASALGFAQLGHHVVVADVDAAAGRLTLKAIEADAGTAIFQPCDVADEESVAELVSVAIDRFGRLDHAHNTVGISPDSGSIVDCTREVWDRIHAVNLTGTWLCMKYEIPAIAASGGGSIVNTSSSAGLTGVAGVAAYVSSKHALIGLTKVAALEAGPLRVRINVICPGTTLTAGLRDKLDQGFLSLDAYKASSPLGRIAEPEEIASAAWWLCSDAASFVTGSVFQVDGGKLAGMMTFSGAGAADAAAG